MHICVYEYVYKLKENIDQRPKYLRKTRQDMSVMFSQKSAMITNSICCTVVPSVFLVQYWQMLLIKMGKMCNNFHFEVKHSLSSMTSVELLCLISKTCNSIVNSGLAAFFMSGGEGSTKWEEMAVPPRMMVPLLLNPCQIGSPLHGSVQL